MKATPKNECELVIDGNIKTLEDYQRIRAMVLDMIANDCNRITLAITDSLSMTSSVIGFLLKVVHQDGVTLSIRVHDERLYSLLDELNLLKVFGVTKV